MKSLFIKLFIIFIYLISSSSAYSIEVPKIKNLILHKQPKKLENIEFQNINNKLMKLNDFKDKFLIINFWATWCAPCREEMPHLNELKSKNEFKDMEIIPINIADEEIKNSKIFFEELGLNNIEIFYGPSIELAKKFKLRGIPTTIFIDKEGYEFARGIGFIDFENKVVLDWLANHL